ncbi:MAG TPA: GNAT family N-acetyltransferase [Chloroflexota bacterium]|nr:GNAT family N-acetyltransferase [Chloroflexota bacterium]
MMVGYLERPAGDALRVVEIDREDHHRWEAFVDAHPEGSIYHHPAWMQTLLREYDRKPVIRACEDSAGQIRGVLPLLETCGLPFNVGRQMIGHRLSSLPRTPVVGPLALDAQAATALVRSAVERVRREPGTQLQLKMDSNSLDGAVDGLETAAWRLTYVLELPQHAEQIRFGNSRNHARIKWAVNKATGAGVSVRPAEAESELKAWYRLYLDTMRWHAAPPRPYRFFHACWELLRPKGLMRLLLAEQTEAGQTKLLSGSILLTFGQTVFYAFNGRRKEDLALRPNDAIHWRAIHDACAEGFRYYDFGEVLEDNKGLAEFKGKWGTEAKRLYRYYYPGLQHGDSHAGESEGRTQQLASAVWRRLPLAATALLGDRIYSYL